MVSISTNIYKMNNHLSLQTLQRHMELETKFLYWDKHKHVTGLSLLTGPSLSDKWVFDCTHLQNEWQHEHEQYDRKGQLMVVHNWLLATNI